MVSGPLLPAVRSKPWPVFLYCVKPCFSIFFALSTCPRPILTLGAESNLRTGPLHTGQQDNLSALIFCKISNPFAQYSHPSPPSGPYSYIGISTPYSFLDPCSWAIATADQSLMVKRIPGCHGTTLLVCLPRSGVCCIPVIGHQQPHIFSSLPQFLFDAFKEWCQRFR